MSYVEALGFLAAFLTTISFLPQAIKVWKTKSTHDISLVMFLVLCAGLASWLLYGILIDSMPIIVANAFTLLLASTILFYKIRYK